MKNLDMKQASKAQLEQITLLEDCPLSLKYAAAREMQFRRKRLAKHTLDQIWRSMRKTVELDFEKIRHKVLQLRDEMTASGIPEATAREFLDSRLSSLNRKIQNTSKGVARKHVKRSMLLPQVQKRIN
jgi:hypothetical protein